MTGYQAVTRSASVAPNTAALSLNEEKNSKGYNVQKNPFKNKERLLYYFIPISDLKVLCCILKH